MLTSLVIKYVKYINYICYGCTIALVFSLFHPFSSRVVIRDVIKTVEHTQTVTKVEVQYKDRIASKDVIHTVTKPGGVIIKTETIYKTEAKALAKTDEKNIIASKETNENKTVVDTSAAIPRYQVLGLVNPLDVSSFSLGVGYRVFGPVSVVGLVSWPLKTQLGLSVSF